MIVKHGQRKFNRTHFNVLWLDTWNLGMDDCGAEKKSCRNGAWMKINYKVQRSAENLRYNWLGIFILATPARGAGLDKRILSREYQE